MYRLGQPRRSAFKAGRGPLTIFEYRSDGPRSNEADYSSIVVSQNCKVHVMFSGRDGNRTSSGEPQI